MPPSKRRPRGSPRSDESVAHRNNNTKDDKLSDETQVLRRKVLDRSHSMILQRRPAQPLIRSNRLLIQVHALHRLRRPRVAYTIVSPAACNRSYASTSTYWALEFSPDTFVRHLDFSALDDLDRLLRFVTRALGAVLDLLDDVVAFEHFAEDDVFAVEPGGNLGRDEELGAVGVFAGVGHACVSYEFLQPCISRDVVRTQKTLLAVLQLEVLILKLLPIDTLAPSTISLREVSTLNHERLDHAVERGALIAKALLSSSQGTEVLSGLQL